MTNDSPRKLSIEEKVGQLFFVGIPGPQLDIATSTFLSLIKPGGICLFARNIKSPEQTRELLEGLEDGLPLQPLLSIDQEGGLVDRLRRILSPMPAPAKLRSAEDAAKIGTIIAEAIRILGFNMDFAPVVDVINEGRSSTNNGLLSRAFASSETDVAAFSVRFLETLMDGGILGCVKHFPGLGASRVDSHEELPVVEIGQEELLERDIFPYRSVIERFNGRVAVMVGHAAYPNTDLQETDQNGKLLPSSLSSNIVSSLLREQLNFDGLVITDDLEMGAIVKNYGIAEACVMAINAGDDMLAICADESRIREGFESVLRCVKNGTIPETRIDKSVARIERFRMQLSQPLPFDPERLIALSTEIAEFSGQL